MAKIADTKKNFFDLMRGGALSDYMRQITDPAGESQPKWRGGDLDEVARSAAIQVGLAYDGNKVDDKIVAAIRVLADPKKTDMDRDEALEEAWEAYYLHP